MTNLSGQLEFLAALLPLNQISSASRLSEWLGTRVDPGRRRRVAALGDLFRSCWRVPGAGFWTCVLDHDDEFQ